MATDFWTREGLIVVLNLYWKIPYNSISGTSNAEVKRIAGQIGRTSGAVAYKLINLTSLDPERQGRGNKGKSGAGKLDRIVWEEYENRWEDLAADAAAILMRRGFVEEYPAFEGDEQWEAGQDQQRLVRVRRNQEDFRQRILASYNSRCCITGLDVPTLIQACHIVPWTVSRAEALNPRNGLCMNSVHHRAFDAGLFTISLDHRVQISKELKKSKNKSGAQIFFLDFDEKAIHLPDRFLPSPDFLLWHHQNRFVQ